MIKARTITGSKVQIAREITGIADDVVEAIVFVNESNGKTSGKPVEDIFAEMEPYMVQVGNVDYSRSSIYAPPEGE
jgi:hypothetical protein